MRNHKINFIFLLFTCLLALGCIHPATDPVEAEIKAVENGLLPVHGDHAQGGSTFNLEERMRYYRVPGVSIAVVKDGKLRWAKGYGYANTATGQKVDTNTLFQAGSISKPVAALSALKLMEEGIVDLDLDVNRYLKSWKIAENDFTKDEKVSLRRLLTHTAGLSVHGFGGYSQGLNMPSIEQVLDGKGNSGRVYVNAIPGSSWRYSGGGYTIMEKVVEDISGLPLEEYMKLHILEPLAMTSSTYEQPLPALYHPFASAAYNREGQLVDGLWHNYPEQAAAGLWTTPSDLAKYCMEIQEVLAGNTPKVLSAETLRMMLHKDQHAWGMGPQLSGEGETLVFQHGGKNQGFTNQLISFAHRGDAVIIMTNADNGGYLIAEILRSVSACYQWDMDM